MIRSVLESLQKATEIAIVHIRGHKKGNTFEARGDQIADQTAKEVALEPGDPVRVLKVKITPEGEERREKPVFSEKELEVIKELKLHQGEQGEWLTPDGSVFLNKALAQKVVAELDKLTYWGIQGLCDHFLRNNLCIGMYDLAKAVTKGCLIYQKVNQKVMRKAVPRGRELAPGSFQSIQIDFS